MIIFLNGPDSYRRERRRKELIAEYLGKSRGLIVERFDLGKENGEEVLRLKEFLENQSIFAGKKLAFLENIFDVAEIKKDIKDLLKFCLKSQELILLISGNGKVPAGFDFLLKNPVLCELFKELDRIKLNSFIKKEAEAKKINFTPQAVKFLAEAFESDTWGLTTEIEKLSLFFKNGPIDIWDIEKVCYYPRPQNIFNFINLFTMRQSGSVEKLVALENLFGEHEDAAKIFNILASQSYRLPELARRLADYDIAVKSGKLDYEEALIHLSLE